MMAYREAELLAMVEKDVVHPDLLFTKDYIERMGLLPIPENGMRRWCCHGFWPMETVW